MSALNNAQTRPRYSDTPQVILYAPLSKRLRIYVRNAAVYRQLGRGGAGGAVQWDVDELLTLPGNYSFDEEHAPFTAVRVRSAIANAPAQVTLEALPQ